MKKQIFLTIALSIGLILTGFSQSSEKLVSSKTQIKFFSSTPAEDIQAVNTTSLATINTNTGEVVFSVPMQGFEFEKALMQKHFNGKDFLNTKAFPKAKLKATISNAADIDFNKDGSYNATLEGEMTIQETGKTVNVTGTIIVKGGVVEVASVFNITLADYGISFVKGKPASNIAKTVEVTVNAEFKGE